MQALTRKTCCACDIRAHNKRMAPLENSSRAAIGSLIRKLCECLQGPAAARAAAAPTMQIAAAAAAASPPALHLCRARRSPPPRGTQRA